MKKIASALLLFSMLMLHTSCNNDEDENQLSTGTATLDITIAGQTTLRNIGPSTTNPALEGIVSNLTVFVFNYLSGDVEAIQSFPMNDGVLMRQVTGLSTGTEKHVVAFVNVPTGLNLNTISNYSQLSTNMITLDSQNSASTDTTGLFMSGETTSAITLSTTGTNTVTIPVSRRVAKVVLQSLIIDPDAAADISLLTLTGVSTQKVRINGSPIGAYLPPVGSVTTNYVGGLASPPNANPNFNLTRTYLREDLAIPAGYVTGTDIIATEDQERYFYVMPNDGSNELGTLLTIAGTYGTTPEPAYYPFLINGTTGSGNSDGTFIQSNKIYAISATLRRFNLYSEDPNVLSSEVVLEVTINPQDWETRINQPVEW